MESSLVLFGSNDATGRIDNKDEQSDDTQTKIKEEPIIITQKRKSVLIY
jgi:hypothetical protein